MKKLILFFALFFSFAAAILPAGAFAESGSASLSCSGNVKLCETCFSEYFYIYTYQYAYVSSGQVSSESHSFSMSGFLGDSNAYRMNTRAGGRHVIWTDGNNTIAVPYRDANDGIWVQGGDIGPGSPNGGWIKLCPR